MLSTGLNGTKQSDYYINYLFGKKRAFWSFPKLLPLIHSGPFVVSANPHPSKPSTHSNSTLLLPHRAHIHFHPLETEPMSEMASDSSSSPEPEPVLAVPDPVRILVETSTHLVPGRLHGERVQRMRNVICQYHWRRDFDDGKDRCYVYGLGGKGPGGGGGGGQPRVCFFMVDSGETASRNENPPILRYRWTGEDLVYIRRALPAVVVAKLKEYPFMGRS
ncbi:hypothetical protein F4802DRAFT_590067 [Xylaria palmicola]|nr:hypothetical protein F4802DRAFT_590067 [Xylaria palmicola]